MALSEFEQKRFVKPVKDYCAKRYPAHLRHQLYLDFRLDNQNIILFVVRPHWKNPGKKVEELVAKATYVKNRNIWRIYWQRADLKWHQYEPDFEVKSIEDFLGVVEKDEYGCFYG